MKIAHLILAHAQPAQLGRLIERLENPDAFFFVHVDAKADIGEFAFLESKKNVFLVRKRVKVSWGAFSIVQATINGFEEIAAAKLGIEYVNLLSGADYPLKSTAAIHTFLDGNAGKNFVDYQLVNEEWTEAITRLTEYHLTNYSFPGKYAVQKLANKILPKRAMPGNLVPVGRSQWLTLSLDAVVYILTYIKENPGVMRFFKLTWAPDEILFQTILYNSELKNTLVNNNLRYIDWAAGLASPKTLDTTDYDRLMQSDALFARKFDMQKSQPLMDLIDKVL